MSTRGYGIVRPRQGTEDRHRSKHERADTDPKDGGGERLPERETEDDRKRAENGGRERVGAAPFDAQKVEDGRGPVPVGYGLNALPLDGRLPF
jgi:hypothetical protein